MPTLGKILTYRIAICMKTLFKKLYCILYQLKKKMCNSKRLSYIINSVRWNLIEVLTQYILIFTDRYYMKIVYVFFLVIMFIYFLKKVLSVIFLSVFIIVSVFHAFWVIMPSRVTLPASNGWQNGSAIYGIRVFGANILNMERFKSYWTN